MATTCEILGNSDMYGLGIRVGFYLQWLSSPIAAWIAPKEAPGLRTANAFFVSATFLGLIIETVLNDLDVTEIYIVLLLAFGTQYIFLFVMLWRIVTGFNSNWDPTRFMKMPTPSRMFWLCYSLLQVAEIVFQLWFWIYKIPRTDNGCERFGFAFFKVTLTSNGFRIFNIILMAALLVITVVFFALQLKKLWKEDTLWLWTNTSAASSIVSEQDSINSAERGRKKFLQTTETIFRIASIAIVILATELTLSWNGIQDVNNTKSVGQLIPLTLSIGGFVHLLLVAIRHHYDGRAESRRSSSSVPTEQDPYNTAVFLASHNPTKEHRSIDNAALAWLGN